MLPNGCNSPEQIYSDDKKFELLDGGVLFTAVSKIDEDTRKQAINIRNVEFVDALKSYDSKTIVLTTLSLLQIISPDSEDYFFVDTVLDDAKCYSKEKHQVFGVEELCQATENYDECDLLVTLAELKRVESEFFGMYGSLLNESIDLARWAIFIEQMGTEEL